MKLLVFEWLCGGGCWFDQRPPTASPEALSLLAQGSAMLEALVSDLLQAGHHINVLVDQRVLLSLPSQAVQIPVCSASQMISSLQSTAKICDAVWLIAPESDGRLRSVAAWMAELQASLISPSLQLIELASDKDRCCRWLVEAGVPVPDGCLITNFAIEEFQDRFSLPLVVKPLDGAGSEGVTLIQTWEELDKLSKLYSWRLESFIPGKPVSVSALCYGETFDLLPATEQLFDAQPFGHYIGAGYPLEPTLAWRAHELAHRVVTALLPTQGYFGIDMVLSDNQPAADTVIEINPRLTLSYLKLREIAGFNLPDQLLKKIFADQPTRYSR